jgi:WbqC-like protein family
MKLAIMQPYFFPYLGYFSLIKHVDKFIVFDTAQYIYHGWIARNRILKQKGGWQYINVHLKKHSHETAINNTLINNNIEWKKKILSQIEHYKKKAPYFQEVKNILTNIFFYDYENIAELNILSLKAVCSYIGIETPMEIYSQMNLVIEQVNAPDEWALNICKAMNGFDVYVNLPGGINFFDKTKYDNANIRIYFHRTELKEYDQKSVAFEPALSIIDLMMFNSAEEINTMLDDFELV